MLLKIPSSIIYFFPKCGISSCTDSVTIMGACEYSCDYDISTKNLHTDTVKV